MSEPHKHSPKAARLPGFRGGPQVPSRITFGPLPYGRNAKAQAEANLGIHNRSALVVNRQTLASRCQWPVHRSDREGGGCGADPVGL